MPSQIIFTLPDGVSQQITNAFCSHFGYSPVIITMDDDGNPKSSDNPQTPEQFTQQKVVEYVRTIVKMQTIATLKSQVDVQVTQQVDNIPVEVEVK